MIKNQNFLSWRLEMKKIIEKIKSKGKTIIIPLLVVAILAAVYIVNDSQTTETAMTYAEDGTFLEASGMVENNSTSLSSEVTGIISEVLVKEGDKVEEGQVIAQIDNSSMRNQYEQALDNLNLASKNVDAAADNINAYQGVFGDSTQQAQSAYNSAQAEYEKVLEGASQEEIKQVEEIYNQAETNLNFIGSNLEESKILLENDIITLKDYEELEKNYDLALSQFNNASAKLDQVNSGASAATKKAAENKVYQAKASHELSISNGNMQLSQLESQYELAKVKYEQAQTIADQLEKELDKVEIKSPINGVITTLTVHEGEFTTMGKTVAEIFDRDKTEIKVYISEANIGHVKPGQEVDIYVDSTDEVFKGEVIRINNNAEFTPKNIQTKEERVNTVFEVKIKVLDTKGVIKAGMPVDVTIKID